MNKFKNRAVEIISEYLMGTTPKAGPAGSSLASGQLAFDQEDLLDPEIRQLMARPQVDLNKIRAALAKRKQMKMKTIQAQLSQLKTNVPPGQG